jgi:hypothetical protein
MRGNKQQVLAQGQRPVSVRMRRTGRASKESGKEQIRISCRLLIPFQSVFSQTSHDYRLSQSGMNERETECKEG